MIFDVQKEYHNSQLLIRFNLSIIVPGCIIIIIIVVIIIIIIQGTQ
jgi:hypothetical protein